MKLKRFFNSDTRNAFVSELKTDFKPILEKVSEPVKIYAKNNPKRTFFLMITIVIMNIIVLFFFTDAFKTKKGVEITDFKFRGFKYGGNSGAAPDITVSFENIRKVKNLRDSLAYLLSLKRMTFQDTLIFIHIMDEFQKISSGASGLPAIKLEDLRKTKQINDLTRDTIIKK